MIVDHNGVVVSLDKQSVENEAKLKQLSDAEFDRAYIDHEVAYHEAVIGVINDTLIPATDNAEFKDTLIAVVPAFEAHLAHSKKIASEL